MRVGFYLWEEFHALYKDGNQVWAEQTGRTLTDSREQESLFDIGR